MTDRELEAWLAEHVMGWRLSKAGGGWFTQPGYLARLPRFTTDANAALRLLERMRERGFMARVDNILKRWDAVMWKGETITSIQANDFCRAVCEAVKAASEA